MESAATTGLWLRAVQDLALCANRNRYQQEVCVPCGTVYCNAHNAPQMCDIWSSPTVVYCMRIATLQPVHGRVQPVGVGSVGAACAPGRCVCLALCARIRLDLMFRCNVASPASQCAAGIGIHERRMPFLLSWTHGSRSCRDGYTTMSLSSSSSPGYGMGSCGNTPCTPKTDVFNARPLQYMGECLEPGNRRGTDSPMAAAVDRTPWLPHGAALPHHPPEANVCPAAVGPGRSLRPRHPAAVEIGTSIVDSIGS